MFPPRCQRMILHRHFRVFICCIKSSSKNHMQPTAVGALSSAIAVHALCQAVADAERSASCACLSQIPGRRGRHLVQQRGRRRNHFDTILRSSQARCYGCRVGGLQRVRAGSGRDFGFRFVPRWSTPKKALHPQLAPRFPIHVCLPYDSFPPDPPSLSAAVG